MAAHTEEGVHPIRAIRRFDVVAEYTRQERLDKGDPAGMARGYGVWLAKVVAARRSGASSASQDHRSGARDDGGATPTPTFRSVGDDVQTDEVFDRDTVDRMGAAFYRQVFRPAIEEARSRGESYEAIRTGWAPAKGR